MLTGKIEQKIKEFYLYREQHPYDYEVLHDKEDEIRLLYIQQVYTTPTLLTEEMRKLAELILIISKLKFPRYCS